MDVLDVKEKRDILEKEIAKLVQGFTNETGVDVDDIKVYKANVTSIGDRDKTFIYKVMINLFI